MIVFSKTLDGTGTVSLSARSITPIGCPKDGLPVGRNLSTHSSVSSHGYTQDQNDHTDIDPLYR